MNEFFYGIAQSMKICINVDLLNRNTFFFYLILGFVESGQFKICYKTYTLIKSYIYLEAKIRMKLLQSLRKNQSQRKRDHDLTMFMRNYFI